MARASESTHRPDDRYLASLTGDGRYRLLVEGITDYAIYMLSPDGLVSSWNPGAERFKGYTAEEIIGRHFSAFYAKDDLEAGLPQRALRIASETGRFENEGWRIRKDGTRFWAYVVIDAIRSPEGELVGFAKITRDLTERRAREEQLRASEEQFRILVQGVSDYALYMLKPSGEISSWNPGAERIKGYRSDEVIGTHFSRFYTETDRLADEPLRALTEAAAEGRYEKEGQRVRKDGSRFWAHVVIDAVHSPEGALLGFAKITRDITAQRESRLALEAARETLFQSQKMDAIGQLTGGVAHDFNNLLMVIQGSLGLLRKRVSHDERALSLVENALQGARRGSALTQRMLAFARRQDLSVAPLSLRELVAGMSDLLASTLESRIELETRFPLHLPNVLADANQLELALINLVVNARDAMPTGGQIVLSAQEMRPEDAPPGLVPACYVRLSVTDTGEGMDAQTLARATEPFFTTKGVGKGTGLGLPMVHGVAQQSGGQLVLRSVKGRGTTADVWLPCAQEAVESAPIAPPRPEATNRAVLILLVDDDALVLDSAAAMLEDLGHRVYQATSGFTALAILDQHPEIELLITDHAMPHMTGTELAQAARARRPELPVILATGYAELPPGVGTELKRLAKPFTQDELRAATNRAVMMNADTP